MEAIDFQSHVQLANHLAKYISSADTIRAHCVRDWGKAPTLQEIVAMQAKYQSRRVKVVDEPVNGDEMMPRLGSLPVSEPTRTLPVVTKQGRNTLWPRWYCPPGTFFDIHALLDSVAGDFGLTRAQLIGSTRKVANTHARAVVVRLLRGRGWSYGQTGKALGGRDHSTIVHADQHFDTYAKQNPLVEISYRQHKKAGWERG